MRQYLFLTLAMLAMSITGTDAKKKQAQQCWPDGTPISEWFSDTTRVVVETLGRKYVITD